MKNWEAYAAYYIKRLDGPDSENAYHSLIEANDAIVPFLIEAFRNEQNPAIRSALVEIIWHHRLPETVEFLSEALGDSAAEVWKSALDGLVALGGQPALRVLKSAKQQIRSDRQAETTRAEWINEAIRQIKD